MRASKVASRLLFLAGVQIVLELQVAVLPGAYAVKCYRTCSRVEEGALENWPLRTFRHQEQLPQAPCLRRRALLRYFPHPLHSYCTRGLRPVFGISCLGFVIA